MLWEFKQQALPAFHDQGWKRADMAAWDEVWAGLSVMARSAFLDLPLPSRVKHDPAAVSLAGPLRDELLAAGLAEETDGRRVRVADEAIGFGKRLQALRKCRLLDPSAQDMREYVRSAYLSYSLSAALDRVMAKNVGVTSGVYADEYLTHYVTRRFWPDWVAMFLGDPVAALIIQGLDAEAGPVPLASLAARLPKRRPEKVREALDGLVNYLAVVEGLHPTTNALLIGFRPQVKADRVRSTLPASLPELTERPAPPELAPEGGLQILDLRAVLLELAGQPGRVRQDLGLYAKEQDRFLATLVEAPEWAVGEPLEKEGRLDNMIRMIQNRGFVDPVDADEKEMLLRLSKAGQAWLSSGLGTQYDQLYRLYREDRKGYSFTSNDNDYLGTALVFRKKGKGTTKHFYTLDEDDRKTMREAVYRAFDRLPEGKYVRLDDFLDAIARGPDNPLLLGTADANKVDVRSSSRPIPAVPDLYEDHGRRLAEEVTARLVRFGCLRLGLEAGEHLVVCRLPWMDVYFGKAKPPTDAPSTATRTIIQPDFTVIIIGIAPAAAADMALFCNRLQGQPGQGAITFRITKESVWRARSTGLTEVDLLARLEKHASMPVPANVKTQIRSWSAQVSNVSTEAGRLFRCPDPATADRVRALLGKEAERVGEAMVFWPSLGRIRPALRQKLRDQGVLLRED
jgi:Helicase conserved C-terminal domain